MTEDVQGIRTRKLNFICVNYFGNKNDKIKQVSMQSAKYTLWIFIYPNCKHQLWNNQETMLILDAKRCLSCNDFTWKQKLLLLLKYFVFNISKSFVVAVKVHRPLNNSSVSIKNVDGKTEKFSNSSVLTTLYSTMSFLFSWYYSCWGKNRETIFSFWGYPSGNSTIASGCVEQA